LLLCGCAINMSDATPGTDRARTRSPGDQTAQSRERASPPPPPQRARDPASTPQTAVRAFATAYINWTAADVSQRMRALATQSVGQARSAVELMAARTAGDYELQQGGIANHGTVEAIAPLPGGVDRGGYLVVTRETTT